MSALPVPVFDFNSTVPTCMRSLFAARVLVSCFLRYRQTQTSARRRFRRRQMDCWMIHSFIWLSVAFACEHCFVCWQRNAKVVVVVFVVVFVVLLSWR